MDKKELRKRYEELGKVMSILLLMSQNKTPETLLLVMNVLKKKQAFLGSI